MKYAQDLKTLKNSLLKCLLNKIFDFHFFGRPNGFWAGEIHELVYF